MVQKYGEKHWKRKKYIFLIIILFDVTNATADESAIECYAKINKIYEDYGTDINKDGLSEYLTIKIGLNVYISGEYTLMGFLTGTNGKEIGWAIDHRNLSIGEQTMYLDFSGKRIRNSEMDGPYFLNSITLSRGSSDTKIINCDYIDSALFTSRYNYLNFTD